MGYTWRVVPISDNQKLDVRSEDLLDGGDFRKCDMYRGGGGYDQFPFICERRFGIRPSKQFVVQLYGCNLDCFYCYVTRSGVWGKWKSYTTKELMEAFVRSEQETFHLMGGAPALYLPYWGELVGRLPGGSVFHSDFLLTERPYRRDWLRGLEGSRGRVLCTVSIKGGTSEEYYRNTRKFFEEELFWGNLDLLVSSSVSFYLTFTNVSLENQVFLVDKLVRRYGSQIMDDSFVIDLISYDAVPFVDSVGWGGGKD